MKTRKKERRGKQQVSGLDSYLVLYYEGGGKKGEGKEKGGEKEEDFLPRRRLAPTAVATNFPGEGKKKKKKKGKKGGGREGDHFRLLPCSAFRRGKGKERKKGGRRRANPPLPFNQQEKRKGEKKGGVEDCYGHSLLF